MLVLNNHPALALSSGVMALMALYRCTDAIM